jgi:hypothetical protein
MSYTFQGVERVCITFVSLEMIRYLTVARRGLEAPGYNRRKPLKNGSTACFSGLQPMLAGRFNARRTAHGRHRGITESSPLVKFSLNYETGI